MDTHQPHSSDSPEVVLERLEASIEETLHRLIDGGRIGARHRESVDDFRRRLASVRRRLEDGGTPTGEMPTDVRSDFDLLAWDYKRWIADVDREFDAPPAQPQGLGRGAP